MPEMMRVAIGLPQDAADEHLIFARQLGCAGVVLGTPAGRRAAAPSRLAT
jgi:hypothetical protein